MCFFFQFPNEYKLIPFFLSLIPKKNHTLVPEIHQKTPTFNPTPLTFNLKKKHFHKKKDKKEGKYLFQVVKKASSSLRFRIKSPPSHLQFDNSLITNYYSLIRVVFYPKKLLF